MVDQESGYRPRRVFIEPEPDSAPPPVPAPAAPAPAAAAPTAPTPAAQPPRTSPAPVRPRSAPSYDDEDAPKPLYRDEYAPWSPPRDEATAVRGDGAPPNGNNGSNGHSRSGSHAAAPGELEAYNSDDTQIRSFTFAPRTRRTGEETTTILARNGSSPRTRGAGAPPSGPEDLDDYDDPEDGKPIGERARWALAIGIIAAVVVLGLAIGYAVLGIGQNRGVTPAPSVTGGSIGPAPTTSVAPDPPTAGGALLTNDLMLSAAQAKRLDGKRGWKETLTQKGASDDGPVPACFGNEPVEGQPTSQQKFLRVLTSTGKGAPGALHDATAYGTAEEAAQAFGVATKTLGTCAAPGAYLESGRLVRGVGDAAAGAVVIVVNGSTTTAHSMIISRTGRVVNVLDASRPGSTPVDPTAVARALGEVVKRQCGPASGKCDNKPDVQPGPPPLGGDVPGTLAVGDLPPAGGSVSPWTATPVKVPTEDFVGSSCENVNWATVEAKDRGERVYLHPDSGTAYFGVNTITLLQKDEKAATGLVEKLKKDLEDCKTRRLTATVSKPAKVSSEGARGTTVSGYTAKVEQRGTEGSDNFRVGIVKAGTKVVYTFANPQGDFNFTDAQWNTIALRAGERATQIT